MERATVLILLTLVTLLSGMGIAAWELYNAEKAKRPDNPTKIGGPTQT